MLQPSPEVRGILLQKCPCLLQGVKRLHFSLGKLSLSQQEPNNTSTKKHRFGRREQEEAGGLLLLN
jgi:hypothetical protein